MINNKFESIVLIGAMGNIAKTFENAWFNWHWNGFSRISSYANEEEAIPTIKALLKKDFNVIAIWDKPTGTGGALMTEGLKKLEMLFRCADATEVELCLCRPDALVEEQWRQYVSDQTVIPDTESIPIDFLEAYTTAMNKWIPSLCRPDQAKFSLPDSDFSKIWSRSSFESKKEQAVELNPSNVIPIDFNKAKDKTLEKSKSFTPLFSENSSYRLAAAGSAESSDRKWFEGIGHVGNCNIEIICKPDSENGVYITILPTQNSSEGKKQLEYFAGKYINIAMRLNGEMLISAKIRVRPDASKARGEGKIYNLHYKYSPDDDITIDLET